MSLFGINFGGSHKDENSTRNTQRNYSSTATTTPNIPQWWMDRYNTADGGLDANGMNADQRTAADFLRYNLASNPMAGAYGAADAATADALGRIGQAGDTINNGVGAINRFGDAIGGNSGTINDATNYLQNQLNNGSYTLGHWFPGDFTSANVTAAGASAANAPAVAAGTGAAYMGSYATPLANDYVNASLNDYDAGAAQGFNGLRAQNASAFGNKRTGVAEGAFMADAARGRGTLSSNLRLNAFNTAADLGQTDASRALAADTTTAGNLLNNNQFNANLAQSNNQFNAGNLLNNNQFNANFTDSRQKFDANQAETGDQRRVSVANNLINAATAGANVNATGADIRSQAVNAASAGVGAAAQQAAVGNQGLGNAINFNSANVGNANALGNFNNMTLQQILSLVNLGQAGIGSTKDESGTDTTDEQTHGSQTGVDGGFKVGW
ncbi:MAG: hypothetical protein ACYCZX_04445 [Rhodospirillaceae bacterium]